MKSCGGGGQKRGERERPTALGESWFRLPLLHPPLDLSLSLTPFVPPLAPSSSDLRDSHAEDSLQRCLARAYREGMIGGAGSARGRIS